jgi:hypothetical protein
MANAVYVLPSYVRCIRLEWRWGTQKQIPFSTFQEEGYLNSRNVTMWQKEQVTTVSRRTAYSDFKYRNIGLIVQMAYEWCQRVGDMRMLQFSNIDYDKSNAKFSNSLREVQA